MGGAIFTIFAWLVQPLALISLTVVTLAVTALSLYNSKKFRRKLMRNTKKQIEKLNKKISKLENGDVLDKLIAKRDKAIKSLEKQVNSYYKVLSNMGLTKIDNYLKADKFLNDKTVLATVDGKNITFDTIRQKAYLAEKQRIDEKNAKAASKKGKKGNKTKTAKKGKTSVQTAEQAVQTPAYSLLPEVVDEQASTTKLPRTVEVIYDSTQTSDEEEIN